MANGVFLCVLFWKKNEFMAQKVTTNKKRKKKEQLKKKGYNPLIQVDKHGDPVSNFITNFKRQFREAKGLLGLGKLFGGKRTEPPKQPAEPESVMGATKTVMRSDYKNVGNSQTVQTGKKTALRMGNTIKTQQPRPKTNKPKLGL